MAAVAGLLAGPAVLRSAGPAAAHVSLLSVASSYSQPTRLNWR